MSPTSATKPAEATWALDPSPGYLPPDRLYQPLRWQSPRLVSMPDLFRQDMPDLLISQVFDVMEQATSHTFLVLTANHERMRAFVTVRHQHREQYAQAFETNPIPARRTCPAAAHARRRADNPPPNIWLGVSAGDQGQAAPRVHSLLSIPPAAAAVRWVSASPPHGAIDLRNLQVRSNTLIDALCGDVKTADGEIYAACPSSVHWVTAAGGTGPDAQPVHPDWIRSLRDQCAATGTPFLFRRWGAWVPRMSHPEGEHGPGDTFINPDGTAGRVWFDHHLGRATRHSGPWGEQSAIVSRISGKRARRDLDGRTWDEYPGSLSCEH